MTSHKRNIAIVGAGIAGLGAAYALKDTANVTVLEKRDRLGGHAATVDIDYDGTPIAVDTGFIVFNHKTYPNLCGLFDAIGVETFGSQMCFGFADGRTEWSSDNSGLFAQRRNLVSPRHLFMLRDILRFNAQAQRDLDAGTIGDGALIDYLARHKFGRPFRENYLLPMGAAIWSTTEGGMMDQPAATVLRFFQNHQLINMKRPKWYTVTGGSREYVRKLGAILGDRVRLSADIAGVRRIPGGAVIGFADGREERFDEVILACHSDQALALLDDPDADEKAYLGAIRYAPNTAVLHRDVALMPKKRAAWASWNYRARPGQDLAEVTYYMNRLQGIDAQKPLFVTLNPGAEIDPATVFGTYQYDHPQFDTAAVAAQRRFNQVQGVRHTWFAGAWLGYGFHEDGLRAGLRVALRLGGATPFAFVEGDVDGGAWGERADIASRPAHIVAAE